MGSSSPAVSWRQRSSPYLDAGSEEDDESRGVSPPASQLQAGSAPWSSSSEVKSKPVVDPIAGTHNDDHAAQCKVR